MRSRTSIKAGAEDKMTKAKLVGLIASETELTKQQIEGVFD